ncbi:tripartite tricarboxylate transporter TctB family protein [Brevibacterium sp. CFH 10365]|uniref:tripartite tricarboxylate transporter TctB family protein n=1 Tax=Brevibacterium sp. CFH 10365 TaxID=2585207 RepID=UPI0018794B86|nr:tripartite tricarboxylate transporter TctB family protein [Brevibacterium sp. CFH 10365]
MNAKTETRNRPPKASPTADRFFWQRSEFVIVGILLAVGTTLIVGSLTMDILGNSVPGPEFVPRILGILLIANALVLAIDVYRRPEPEQASGVPDRANFSTDMLHDLGQMEDAEDSVRRVGDRGNPDEKRMHSDWKTIGIVLVACIGFVALLEPVGWILSAAALFWVIARALGSVHPIMDIWVAVFLSSIIQLIFGGLLGLPLPAGIIGGL